MKVTVSDDGFFSRLCLRKYLGPPLEKSQHQLHEASTSSSLQRCCGGGVSSPESGKDICRRRWGERRAPPTGLVNGVGRPVSAQSLSLPFLGLGSGPVKRERERREMQVRLALTSRRGDKSGLPRLDLPFSENRPRSHVPILDSLSLSLYPSVKPAVEAERPFSKLSFSLYPQ